MSSRARKQMEKQWPEALALLSGAFRSGLNLDQALGVMAHEAPDPLRMVLKTRWDQGQAWMPRQQLIRHLFQDAGLDLVRAALLLAHETGARQSELVDRCARLLSDRLEFREKVEVLTAQGRLTAWVVGLSPVFIFLMMGVLSPDLTQPLVETAAGRILLSVVGLMVAIGLWVVHRMARIDV